MAGPVIVPRSEAVEPAPTHPEEIRAAYDVSIGNFIRLQGSARVTPAGVICAGIATSAILLAVAAVVRARGR